MSNSLKSRTQRFHRLLKHAWINSTQTPGTIKGCVFLCSCDSKHTLCSSSALHFLWWQGPAWVRHPNMAQQRATSSWEIDSLESTRPWLWHQEHNQFPTGKKKTLWHHRENKKHTKSSLASVFYKSNNIENLYPTCTQVPSIMTQNMQRWHLFGLIFIPKNNTIPSVANKNINPLATSLQTNMQETLSTEYDNALISMPRETIRNLSRKSNNDRNIL